MVDVVVDVEVEDEVVGAVLVVVAPVELEVVAPADVDVEAGAVELVEVAPPAEVAVASLVVVTRGAVVVGEGRAGKPTEPLFVGSRGTARNGEVIPTEATSSTTWPVVVVESPPAKKDSGSKVAAAAGSGCSLPRNQLTPPNTPRTRVPATITTIAPETKRASRTLSRREALTLRGAVSARCLATLFARSSGLTRPPSGLGKGGLPFPPGLPARKSYDRRALLSTGYGVCRGPGPAVSPNRPRGQGLLLFGNLVAATE